MFTSFGCALSCKRAEPFRPRNWPGIKWPQSCCHHHWGTRLQLAYKERGCVTEHLRTTGAVADDPILPLSCTFVQSSTLNSVDAHHRSTFTVYMPAVARDLCYKTGVCVGSPDKKNMHVAVAFVQRCLFSGCSQFSITLTRRLA